MIHILSEFHDFIHKGKVRNAEMPKMIGELKEPCIPGMKHTLQELNSNMVLFNHQSSRRTERGEKNKNKHPGFI